MSWSLLSTKLGVRGERHLSTICGHRRLSVRGLGLRHKGEDQRCSDADHKANNDRGCCQWLRHVHPSLGLQHSLSLESAFHPKLPRPLSTHCRQSRQPSDRRRPSRPGRVGKGATSSPGRFPATFRVTRQFPRPTHRRPIGFAVR